MAWEPCPTCGGAGSTNGWTCPTCLGGRRIGVPDDPARIPSSSSGPEGHVNYAEWIGGCARLLNSAIERLEEMAHGTLGPGKPAQGRVLKCVTGEAHAVRNYAALLERRQETAFRAALDATHLSYTALTGKAAGRAMEARRRFDAFGEQEPRQVEQLRAAHTAICEEHERLRTACTALRNAEPGATARVNEVVVAVNEVVRALGDYEYAVDCEMAESKRSIQLYFETAAHVERRSGTRR